MERFAITLFVALGLTFGWQEVRAQEAEIMVEQPEVIIQEEEVVVPEGEEVPILEEGEGDGVTERGIGRFKFKGSPKSKKKFSRFFKFRPRTPPPQTETGGGQSQDDPPVTTTPPQCVVKTSDIALNPMIDIGFENKFQSSLQNPNDSSAQQSLMRMMSRGNFQERAAASGMVQAIKQGRLAGIFRTDKQAAWKKARGFAGQFIPAGENAMCFTTPAGEQPMIIYRNIRFPPSVFDGLLVSAWNQCGLSTPNPPCEYVKDMGIKQPVTPQITDDDDSPKGEKNKNGETSLRVSLVQFGEIMKEKAGVFVRNQKFDFQQVGKGTLIFRVEPGAYQIQAQEVPEVSENDLVCGFSSPEFVIVESGKSASITIEVPICIITKSD